MTFAKYPSECRTFMPRLVLTDLGDSSFRRLATIRIVRVGMAVIVGVPSIQGSEISVTRQAAELPGVSLEAISSADGCDLQRLSTAKLVNFRTPKADVLGLVSRLSRPETVFRGMFKTSGKRVHNGRQTARPLYSGIAVMR
jgi:hypothetical protein